MAVVWTSSGKRTASAKAVGTGGAPGQTGPAGAGIVLWDPDPARAPTAQDVIDNQWVDGTVLFEVIGA